MKSDKCKNRSDTAGETINIEWHVCPGDTKVQIYNSFMETGHEPESFPDRIIFASMFNDMTDYGSKKVQGKCLAKEVATYAARFRLGYWCFCGPGSEQTWTHNESRPSSHSANGEWEKVASVMISELITS